MGDAVAAVVARKVALDAARAALRSGAISEMESALHGLPSDGEKARRLRTALTVELEGLRGRQSERVRIEESVARCVSDGIEYAFRVADADNYAFFEAKREGAGITITINANHPFGHELSKHLEFENPPLLALLASWAHLELEQGDERRRSVLQDARVDWGRVLRRLLVADKGFAGD